MAPFKHLDPFLSSPWYLYIVENKLEQYYTGICTDIKRRFAEHQSGGKKCAKALKGKSPITLKYCVQLMSHSDALKAEIWVKKLSRPKKEALVAGVLKLDAEHQLFTFSDVNKLSDISKKQD